MGSRIDSRRSDLEYDCMEMGRFDQDRNKELSPFFLRKIYSGTKAEVKDDTQAKLHEFDWRRKKSEIHYHVRWEIH